MKVLIVDDSKPILMMVSQMLEELGHESISAIDGSDAYHVIAVNKGINLILLDWNMPVMNGLEFLQKNKSDSIFNIPIFMMTTETSPEKIQIALENGVVDYIMKPFTPDILQNKIEMLLELAG
jgi:two-component system, chemotaxis family, chemotaxis protein CheY